LKHALRDEDTRQSGLTSSSVSRPSPFLSKAISVWTISFEHRSVLPIFGAFLGGPLAVLVAIEGAQGFGGAAIPAAETAPSWLVSNAINKEHYGSVTAAAAHGVPRSRKPPASPDTSCIPPSGIGTNVWM